MKTNILLFGILLVPVLASAQWVKTTLYSKYNYNYVFFVNDSTGYIVGSNGNDDGLLLKTTNGGISWDSTHFESALMAVHFPNIDNGYITTNGINEQLFKTTDGGKSWYQTDGCASNCTQGLHGLFFIDTVTGFWSNNGGIAKITDGGSKVEHHLPAGYQSNIEAICFVNKDVGYAGGWYDPLIFKTSNGGISWSVVKSGYGIYGLHFPSENTGYATANSLLHKTTDGGATWTLQTIDGASNRSLNCIDNNTCFTAGNGGLIYSTHNGGETWTNEISGTTTTLNSIYCTKNGTCFAVGDSGVILKSMNNTGILTSTNKISSKFSVFPNPTAGQFLIKYKLQRQETNAYLLLVDANGKLLHKIAINHLQGEQAITLDSTILSSGWFQCTLYINDKMFESQKIVLTH